MLKLNNKSFIREAQVFSEKINEISLNANNIKIIICKNN